MRRALALSLLLLGIVPGVAAAQGPGGISIGTGPGSARGRGWVPLVGARYSNVQGVSGSLLLLRDQAPGSEEYRGWFVASEAGIHGVSASIGSGGWAQSSGGSLRASLLRSWGDGGRLAGGQSFVGGEARVSIVWATFGGGYYRRIRGSAPGDGSIFAFTIGFGY